MTARTYTSGQAAKVARTSLRRINYWSDADLFGAGTRVGSGVRRRFTRDDIVVAAVLARLSNMVSLVGGNGRGVSIDFAHDVVALLNRQRFRSRLVVNVPDDRNYAFLHVDVPQLARDIDTVLNRPAAGSAARAGARPHPDLAHPVGVGAPI